MDEKLKKPFNYLHNSRHQQTKNNHCRNRKIKPEIFFFNSYISRQPADPMKFIMKKPDDYSGHHNDDTNDNDILTGFTVHIAKLQEDSGGRPSYSVKG
jgi:hypothetical protein